jgi:hypothetical protein
MAKDEGREDQSVFDPLPLARERDQREADTAFPGAFVRRIENGRTRSRGGN